MKGKKLALMIAGLLATSSVAGLAGCNKNNGGDTTKPDASTTTYV